MDSGRVERECDHDVGAVLTGRAVDEHRALGPGDRSDRPDDRIGTSAEIAEIRAHNRGLVRPLAVTGLPPWLDRVDFEIGVRPGVRVERAVLDPHRGLGRHPSRPFELDLQIRPQIEHDVERLLADQPAHVPRGQRLKIVGAQQRTRDDGAGVHRAVQCDPVRRSAPAAHRRIFASSGEIAEIRAHNRGLVRPLAVTGLPPWLDRVDFEIGVRPGVRVKRAVLDPHRGLGRHPSRPLELDLHIRPQIEHHLERLLADQPAHVPRAERLKIVGAQQRTGTTVRAFTAPSNAIQSGDLRSPLTVGSSQVARVAISAALTRASPAGSPTRPAAVREVRTAGSWWPTSATRRPSRSERVAGP